MTYPKRLIKVDLPIKPISAHSRREKSICRGPTSIYFDRQSAATDMHQR